MPNPWHLQGPDDNNHLWIHIGKSSFNLGPIDDALDKLAKVLAENDYEEREPNELGG